MKKWPLHWQILVGMLLGVVYGLLVSKTSWGQSFTEDWIKPIGTIFIRLLKLIAIPLIIVSLTKGISDLQDIGKFSRIGLRTIGLYVLTTVIAITLGLVMVNVFQPGAHMSAETISQLESSFATDATSKVESAIAQKESGPLKFIVDMVPDNFFSAASSNTNMLQVIFFVIFFGISLLLINKQEALPVQKLINGLNEAVMKMVDMIMLMAPYAVFALLASLITEYTNPDLLTALLFYGLTVVAGLAVMVGLYAAFVWLYTGKTPKYYFQGIAPAQLLAFSTSSSAATLPVTMERVEEHLGVEGEVASFVCPVGATINMDGTSLYQAVAAVFICQALQFDLSLSGQLTIILTATLASIGSAAVPGAGMVMLVIVLESVGLPADKLALGLALIFAVDRPLDMCRTAVNVSGDAAVSMLVASSVGKLGRPVEKKLDDFYKKD
jgi:Na+/H+-dicarboxylate symporter